MLGIWGGASRRKVQVRDDHGNGTKGSGPWVQVSRLGNPLFNEVIVPLGDKDRWNAPRPDQRRPVREVRQAAGALAEAPASPLPRRVPAPRCVHEGPGRPRGDPADGHPERNRRRVPELHDLEALGHAAAERRHPADDLEPERTRRGRRRSCRLPERAAGVRRRRLDRAEGVRGCDHPARRPELHAVDGAVGLVSSYLDAGDRPLSSRRFPYLGTPHDGYDTPSS